MTRLLYSLFSAFVRVFSQSSKAFGRPGRLKTYATYARLKVYQYLAHVFNLKVTEVTIFGYHWRFFSFSSFVYVFEEIFFDRPYVRQNTSTAPVILDAGSNIGLATLFFKIQFPDAQILCFEPDPEAFKVLSQNINSNHLKQVTLLQKALGKVEGELSFYKHEGPAASVGSGLIPRTSVNQLPSLTVSATRLSNFLKSPVDFLKLDIEGGELDSLLEAGAHLTSIQEMVIECHHRPEIETHLSQVLGLLTAQGFKYRLSAQAPRHVFGSLAGQDILIKAVRA